MCQNFASITKGVRGHRPRRGLGRRPKRVRAASPACPKGRASGVRGCAPKKAGSASRCGTGRLCRHLIHEKFFAIWRVKCAVDCAFSEPNVRPVAHFKFATGCEFAHPKRQSTAVLPPANAGNLFKRRARLAQPVSVYGSIDSRICSVYRLWTFLNSGEFCSLG